MPDTSWIVLPPPDQYGRYKFEDGSMIVPAFPTSDLRRWLAYWDDRMPLRGSDDRISYFASALEAAACLAAGQKGPGHPPVVTRSNNPPATPTDTSLQLVGIPARNLKDNQYALAQKFRDNCMQLSVVKRCGHHSVPSQSSGLPCVLLFCVQDQQLYELMQDNTVYLLPVNGD
jgi:hypothetical protein